MAYQHVQSSHHGSHVAQAIWSGVKSVVLFVGHIFQSIPDTNMRVRQLEALQAKSDKELAAMGLRREDIARYVFRDTLYL